MNQTPTFSTNDPNQTLKKWWKLINGRQKINKLDKNIVKTRTKWCEKQTKKIEWWLKNENENKEKQETRE